MAMRNLLSRLDLDAESLAHSQLSHTLRLPHHSNPLDSSKARGRLILVQIQRHFSHVLAESTSLVQRVTQWAGVYVAPLPIPICLLERPPD